MLARQNEIGQSFINSEILMDFAMQWTILLVSFLVFKLLDNVLLLALLKLFD